MTEPGVFFIATAHDEYRTRRFPEGSVVIDPWRMIPDQEGVTVRRLGENRPALISLLLPSRGRPEGMQRMWRTALERALFPRQVEAIVYVDDDDPRAGFYEALGKSMCQLRMIRGPRQVLSECWNDCFKLAGGEILMHCGDDITFETDGWDQIVRDAFEAVPDKILFAFGDDLSTNFPDLGTHGFVHRRWVEIVGYFVPPLFSSDWNDVWLTDVAKMVKRMHPLPQLVTEHHHYTFGKAERDQTHAEREERGARDNVVTLYQETLKRREVDAAKLRAALNTSSDFSVRR
jgi:hypothetical protein